MKLNKILGASCAFSAILGLASCGNKAPYKDLEAIKKKGEIVVATNAEFAPFEYKEGAEFKGIDMEIIMAYAKDLGVKCTIADQEFDAALLSASTGKADIAMAGITKNAKREETLSFTDSYYEANQVVIVPAESVYASLEKTEDILSALTTNKAKVGVQRGTTGEYFTVGDADWGFDGIADTTCSTYDNGAMAVQALKQGKVDAVIIDAAPANVLASKNEGVKVLPAVLTEEEYAIAAYKGNTTLIQSLNDYIKKIKANGEFDAIVAKYF